MINFWQTPEWIKMKTFIAKTEKVLSRVEYLKLMGCKNYSEDNYKRYLEIMKSDEDIR